MEGDDVEALLGPSRTTSRLRYKVELPAALHRDLVDYAHLWAESKVSPGLLTQLG